MISIYYYHAIHAIEAPRTRIRKRAVSASAAGQAWPGQARPGAGKARVRHGSGAIQVRPRVKRGSGATRVRNPESLKAGCLGRAVMFHII